MRLLLLFTLLVQSTSSFCQTGNAGSRWAIGLNGSVDRASRSIRYDGDNPAIAELLAYNERHDRPRVAFSFGVEVRYMLGDHWSLASGLQISDRGFASSTEFQLIATDTLDPALSGVSARIEERYHYRYLSIPVVARFAPGSRKLRFNSGIGIQADWLASHFKVFKVNFSDGRRTRDREFDNVTEYKAFGISALLDAGCEWRITETWRLGLAARARYQLTPVADTPIIGHLHEVGGLVSVTHQL